MAEIVTLTMNLALDISPATQDLRPIEKLRCSTPRNEPGGGGINVTRVITALGGQAIALFPAGGPAGETLQGLLAAADIAFEALPIIGTTRENFTVDETDTGRQYRFVLPGPALSPPEWSAVLDRLDSLPQPPRYVVASGSLPPGFEQDFYARVGQACKGLGAHMVLDCPGGVLAASAGARALLVKPNLLELESAAGHPTGTGSERVIAARRLIDLEIAEIVVVSNGAADALLVTREDVTRLAAATVPILSSVGAGDSMVAAITLGLSRGMSLRDAVRYGMAAGAAAVMTPAGTLARREDADRLFHAVSSTSLDNSRQARAASPLA